MAKGILVTFILAMIAAFIYDKFVKSMLTKATTPAQ